MESCGAETALDGGSSNRHDQRRNRVLKDIINFLVVVSQAEVRRNYVQVLEYHTDDIHRAEYEMNTRIPDIIRTARAITRRINDI